MQLQRADYCCLSLITTVQQVSRCKIFRWIGLLTIKNEGNQVRLPTVLRWFLRRYERTNG